MTPRFLAIVGEASGDRAALIDRLTGAAARSFELHPVYRGRDVLVLADAATPIVKINDGSGVMLGTVFRRADSAAGAHQRVLEVRLNQPEGEHLARAYWGSYVAFLANPLDRTVHIARDPSGAVACYRARADGLHIFYSDVGVAHQLGLVKGGVDPEFVAHYLAYPDLRVARTGLVGVQEALAGTGMSIGPSGAETVSCCWTPWAFASSDNQIKDRGEAARMLRHVTEHCVSAWASQSGSICLELSGGLDSSIVAACLRDHDGGVSCINLVTPDPGADERRYAGRMAALIGAPLKSVGLSLDDGVVTRAPRMLSPRPGLGVLQQVIDHALAQEAARLHPDSIFTGGGGDNVFCYLNTAAPAADVLRTRGVGPLFMKSVGDLARLHGCTTWRAGGLAIRKALRGPRPWPQNCEFLSSSVIPPRPWRHPWLEAPRGALPGKREHVASLMAIQNAPDGKERQSVAPIRYPLLSQPLVELCLRIPSWMWITGGRNRSLARDAFADLLPPMILQRRTKGDFTGFLAAIYQRQRTQLAELLLDGWLAREGILDRPAAEAYLAADTPIKDTRFYRLLEMAGVEVWARSWADRSAPADLDAVGP